MERDLLVTVHNKRSKLGHDYNHLISNYLKCVTFLLILFIIFNVTYIYHKIDSTRAVTADRRKVAVIVEDRPLSNLVPVIVHF